MPRTAHLDKISTNQVALYLNESDEPQIVDISQGIILGRASPSSNMQPTIDLTAHGGYEKGVSRLHATIRRTEAGELMLIDQGSANGTFLGETRLAAFVPTRLKSGDTIRLGKLTVDIYFGDITGSSAAKDQPTEAELFSLHREVDIKEPDAPVSAAPPAGQVQPAPSSSLATNVFPDTSKPPAPTRFRATVSIDPARVFSQSGAITEKVLRQLQSIQGCSIQLVLEIDGRASAGFDEATVNAINAACQELKFTYSRFDGS
jgi:pSer/pThr/pTyr-binding forkhead associated (FHA) protein